MAEEISTVIPATKRTTKTTKAVVGVGKGKKREVKRNIPTELIPVEEEHGCFNP